jgi:DNA-binding IscR family transcriptional regulator
VPARDIETITLSEISGSVRDEFQDIYSALNDFISIPGIEKILSEVQNAIDNTLSKETLKDLVTSRTRENKKTI